MGYLIQIDSLIKLPKNFHTDNLKVGQRIIIEKEDERLVPLHKPVEFCDYNYNYLGKLQINKLTLEKNKTIMDATILKLFTKQESKVYSQNYIKDEKRN